MVLIISEAEALEKMSVTMVLSFNPGFKKLFCFLIFLIFGFPGGVFQNLFCQDMGFKYIKNYTRSEYDNQPQNWWVLQDSRGIIFVGNHGGLLEFDGVSWRSIHVPNWSVRSLAVDNRGTIFVGGKDEIGRLAPDEKAALRYVSLLHQVDEDKRNFSIVWKTHSTREGIYFHTLKYLLRWDTKKMKLWQADVPFNASFSCGGKLFLRQEGVGLLQMVKDSLKLVPGGEVFAAKKIYMMVPYDAEAHKLLVGTLSGGFYIYDGKKAVPFPTEADDYLQEKRLYYGIRLSCGNFALATLRGGLVIIDAQGRLKEILTMSSGLLDDNVKYIFEDSQGNLWLSLNNGLSKIEYASPFSLFDHRSGLPGLVLVVIRHEGNLYVGTTSGLYVLVSGRRFRPVAGISGNCWSLLSIGDSVLAATSDGTFQVQNEARRMVIRDPSYVLLQSQKKLNRVWVGTQRGLISLYLSSKDANKKGLWALQRRYEGITQEIRTMVEERRGSLWLGTLTQGVIRVESPLPGSKIDPVVTRFHTCHGLPPKEVNVFWAAGHVMFATEKGIFRFDEKKKVFVPDYTLGKEFADGSRSVFRLVEDKNRNIWLHSWSENFWAIPQPDGTFVVKRKPFLRLPDVQVNAIYPEPDRDIVWFCGTEGLICFNKKIKKDYEKDFSCLIRKVLVNGNLIFAGFANKPLCPVIPYRDRNLRFDFAAPFFEGESNTRYRCTLEGYDEDWSKWTAENRKDYTNLDSGLYRFRVQARNVYGHLSQEASFRFKLLPPWYQTWWAFLGYGLMFFLIIYLIVSWRSRKLEQEKRTLEHIIGERTKEINQKNRLLEDQSERLKDLDKMKSHFFANISHEFRTPLTLIMGPLDQMLLDCQEKNQKKKLALMLGNSQRLFTLINQLLDLSKLDSGKMRLQASEQNVAPILKGIVASFDLLAVQKKLDLQLVQKEENIRLYFDAEKMEKVTCNLLANAIKFTPPGGIVTVTVARNPAREENFPAGSLVISVGDTGIGISKDQLDHIFERFYQAKGAAVQGHDYKGTGIGLALTRELVALHHGSIEVHSRQGQDSGTEFVIRLPLGWGHLNAEEIVDLSAPSVEMYKYSEMPASYLMANALEEVEMIDEDETTKKDEESEPKSRGRDLILVVEDNADMRLYIRGTLESLYQVVEAANGRQGIRRAQKIIPDLIISDIMMPEADGYELCNVLKKNIKTCHIPIILLTAKASEESMMRGLETGADDYITKPFSTRMLLTRIKNLIELRRALQLKIQRQKMLLPDEISVSSMDEEFLKEFQAILEKNLSEPEFDIDCLCKALYMGRTTLFRKIEALTGQTPKQFIQSYRLERAAQLLKANYGNVTQVAIEVGFSNIAYFSKCFKEKFQQLPSNFQSSESS